MSGTGVKFSEQFLNEIRARIAVSTVVGRKVKLTRQGREFVGLSPFSQEKSPSFTVSDEKGFYHCFSSQEHGDIFAFLMKTQSLTFPEAVELLAEEAGVEMPQRTAAETQKAAKATALLPLIDAACRIFEETLWEPAGRTGLDYLRGRGLSEETIKRFRLGYAPGGNVLKARLLQRGFGEYLLLEAGLISAGQEGRESFDFFRERVMFPILDQRGRPVAFGGRTLGDAKPKYLNSSDGPTFHKGAMLYGLSLARDAAREAREIIVAEGYMDVIALAQAGIENVVAPLGTALTEGQLGLLWRYAAEPTLCFDGDKAGRAAAVRAADRALPLLQPGFSLRFAMMPAGQDPDDICKTEGAAAMRDVLQQCQPLSMFTWLQLLATHETNTPERLAGFVKAMGAKAAEIKDETVRTQYRQFFRARMEATFPASSDEEPVGAAADEGGHERVDDRGGEPLHDPYHDEPTPEDILGHHCPIKALGHAMRLNGIGAAGRTKVYHFLNSKGEVESHTATALRSPANISGLFGGNETWLEEMHPNKTAEGMPLPGDKSTWKLNRIVPLLQRACAAAGFFDPEDMVRGPGVWPFGPVKEWPRRDPRIVVHTGRWVYVMTPGGAALKQTGGARVGDFIYCRTRDEDDIEAEALTDDEAARLIRFYDGWNFEEKARVMDMGLAGFLAFGWLASAGIPALLPIRPTLFIRGSSKIGKSAVVTFHEVLLGTAAARMENATMTGLRIKFLDPQPARALLCNESNKSENPQTQEQLRQVLNVALYCYTAGEGRQERGPGGISGSINASFMFSAVRPPSLNSDDANRMLLLNMKPLLPLTAQQLADYKAWREDLTPLGPRLRRRILDRWGDYPKTFAAFEGALISLGYDTREADTFGTLMACAWLGAKSKLPTKDQARDIASAVSGSMLVQAADEIEPEWKQCWTHLITAKVEGYSSHTRMTLGELIADAIDGKAANNGQASRIVKNYGLAVVRRKSRADKATAEAQNKPHIARQWVAVSYLHQGLEEIFRSTRWKDAGWSVLAQMPDAEKNHPANFAGQKRGKATLIPIDDFQSAPDDETYADDPEEERYRKENTPT